MSSTKKLAGEAKQTAHIVLLQGQGDIDCRIVDQATWDWINGPAPAFPPGQSSVTEAVPGTDAKAQVTSGSFDNDRAIQCRALVDGLESKGQAKRKLAQLGYAQGDIYEGCIY